MSVISASEALKRLKESPDQYGFLDVRSEGEWEKAQLPGFINVPVLNDEERHQVGLCYKEQGQDKAIELGYELVLPHKAKRLEKWRSVARRNRAMVCCWRGGLRSKKTCHYLDEAGVEVLRIDGGYKALRHELLKQLENPPELLVLSGHTGSGKTELIVELDVPKVDLEGAANHRGSAFGYHPDDEQPAQTTFENTIAFEMLGQPRVLIEDESKLIGRCHLTAEFKAHMNASPTVRLIASMDQRVENIINEYIRAPLARGVSLEQIQQHAEHSLNKIQKKLGGLRHKELMIYVRSAFANPSDSFIEHYEWIEQLLVDYYDPMYEHAHNRNDRQIVFEGDMNACKDWIKHQFA